MAAELLVEDHLRQDFISRKHRGEGSDEKARTLEYISFLIGRDKETAMILDRRHCQCVPPPASVVPMTGGKERDAT